MDTFKKRLILAVTVFALAAMGSSAMATPIFQTYINGGAAGDRGEDMDTWFTGSHSFDLFVVGHYQGNVSSIDNAWLIVSVPEGEKGSIGFTTVDDSPLLIDGTPADAYGVPFSNANVDLLTDPIGDDGYATKGGFLPDGVSFNNHYPFKDEISDFLVYELGAFGDSEFVNNYDADVGTVSSDSKPGEQKEYGVSYTGFSKLHFDVIGQVTNKQGRTDWKINPGSHDASAVPEPCTMLLLGTGLAGFAGTRIRKRFKK